MNQRVKIKKMIDDYKRVQNLYADYGRTIKLILEHILKAHNYDFQVVSTREKDIKSLQKKLLKPVSETKPELLIDTIKNLGSIRDLSGCRIIFYLQKDIERFVELISHEFDIVKDSHKLIYSEKGYNATHITIKLKKRRTNLLEYKKFSGLKCEIQLTTVLYHGWSEIEHNIIYKPDEDLRKFDEQSYSSLKESLEKVMTDNIKRAQFTFDVIAAKLEDLKNGKKIFDESFLKNIPKLKDNNDLYENLKILLQYTEKLGDKTPKTLNLLEIIKVVLKKAKSTQPTPIKTPFGEYDGRTYQDIANICLDIIKKIKFFKPEQAFDLLAEMSEEADQSIKGSVLEVLNNFARYNLRTLKQIGYRVQIFILEKVESWNDETLLARTDFVAKAINNLLSPSFEGHEMTDFQTFTFQQGALSPNQTLIEIRKRSILIGEKLYSLTKDLTQKVNILKALQEASRSSDHGNADEKMNDIIADDINSLIDLYISFLPDAENEIIQEIDEQSYWFSKWFQREKLEHINELESLINSNKIYNIYRIFVGYDTRLSEDTNYAQAQNIRDEKIKNFTKDLTNKTYKKWSGIIDLILKNYNSSFFGEFRHLRIFFEQLGTEKPDIALKLFIEKKDKIEEDFSVSFLCGIWMSKKKKTLEKLMGSWIKNGVYLNMIPLVFAYTKKIDIGLLKKVLTSSKAENNLKLYNSILKAVTSTYTDHIDYKIIFIETVKKFTLFNNRGWIYEMWFKSELIINSLSKKDIRVILNSLLSSTTVDLQVESILGFIADRYPLLVVEFFHERIKIKSKKTGSSNTRYDVIPYHFNKLKEHLVKHEKVIIPAIFMWYKKGNKTNKWLYQWEASEFLSNLFPGFNKEVEAALFNLINKNNPQALEIASSLLSKYEGQDFLYGIVRALLIKYKSKRTKNSIFGYLSQTGVVSGFDGFVNAFQSKKQGIQVLKNGEDKIMKKFAVEYEKYLDTRITYEKKSAENELETRKIDFTI